MNKNNNPKQSIILPLLLAVTLICGIIIGLFLPATNKSVTVNQGIRPKSDKLSYILNIIEADYVDTVNKAHLVESAIPTILGELDPHSVYIPAKDLVRSNEPIQGNFEGIGIQFNTITDTLLVLSTVSGGPSEKVGIQAGDKFIYINDTMIAGTDIDDETLMSMLKGPKGSTVNVKVLRKGHSELLSFSIVRDKIPLNSIDISYMINEKTGYIKITNFALTTFNEFQAGLRSLKSKGMENLIIDLRNNPGGIMEAAIQIANQFLDEGEMIVYTEGRTQRRNEARATGQGEFKTGGLVILIDELSASASEILAGAIQDNDRGTIIGRRSFGKGLVQEPVSFSDGSGMRLTIARYYTPTGRSIQKPYNNGFNKYFTDLETRYLHKEFEIADSIHFPDSLKFITPKGKTVYGGGGIMPDVFVPVDTTAITPYFLKASPLIYKFALSFTESHRDTLVHYKTAADMEQYLVKQNLVKQFVRYAAKNNVAENPKEIKESKQIIDIQLKAYIARNILDNQGFYPIWGQIDKTLQIATEYFDNQDSDNQEDR